MLCLLCCTLIGLFFFAVIEHGHTEKPGKVSLNKVDVLLSVIQRRRQFSHRKAWSMEQVEGGTSGFTFLGFGLRGVEKCR